MSRALKDFLTELEKIVKLQYVSLLFTHIFHIHLFYMFIFFVSANVVVQKKPKPIKRYMHTPVLSYMLAISHKIAYEV